MKPWFYSLFSHLLKVIEAIAVFLCLASLFLVGYEVIMRYIFASPHDWGDELALITMLYSLFLVAIVALREDKHTNIDLLLLKLSERKRTIWEIFITSVTIITCGAYAWAAVKIVQTLKLHGLASPTSLKIPFWISYLVLPISLWLCTLVSMEKLLKLLFKLRRSRDS